MCKLGVHLSVQSSMSLLMCPEVVYALRLMLDELGVRRPGSTDRMISGGVMQKTSDSQVVISLQQ